MIDVLAHQGGWDEALMVLVPLAFLALLLRVAHVRAEKLEAFEEAADGDEGDA